MPLSRVRVRVEVFRCLMPLSRVRVEVLNATLKG